ncbi:aliphatic sulfonate ABC transporter substrate-binding protein [Microbacterium sp. HD4P20]|uniref:aliphatic sulfonate ABC transporter substrate-binding protein n=1 Tax=Microbacterium sp. HD4P20 TaxID=2864874 RepID=UPI001C63E8C6|nr:aliphatic sulfonate ABC transporter substrate-binding protein [Microbacterium sp. HD4P20]MCP2638307.1 aliphatic sulfonate ABC transporter substrate-binding protein [Microbacterium sp. HD4P20]
MNRKLIGAAAAGIAVAVALTGCASGSGGSPDAGDADESEYEDVIDVDFGYIPDFNGTSLLAIAEDQGLWDKYGLNVTTQNFTNGPLQIQALGTGDLDFGYIGPGAVWLPASGQAKIVALNTLGQADRVVAQAGIESIEDLRGKTVAFPEGTSGDMILTLALEEAGMTKDDINAVAMEPAAIVAALSSKQVDGAGFWYPALATVMEQVPDLVELAENSDFEDTVAFPTAFVAGNDVVADEPEKVDRVLKALREAIAFRAENTDEAIQLTADFSALDPAQVEADAGNVQILSLEEIDALTEDGTVDTWLAGMVDYFVAAGKLTEPADPADFYTGDLFLQAGE